MIHIDKGFGIVNKAEIDIFLELSCFFDDPAELGDLIYCSSAFSKTNLHIWKSKVHLLLKPSLENFDHYFTSVWDEWSCAYWSNFLSSWPCNVSSVLESVIIGLFICLCTDLFLLYEGGFLFSIYILIYSLMLCLHYRHDLYNI